MGVQRSTASAAGLLWYMRILLLVCASAEAFAYAITHAGALRFPSFDIAWEGSNPFRVRVSSSGCELRGHAASRLSENLLSLSLPRSGGSYLAYDFGGLASGCGAWFWRTHDRDDSHYSGALIHQFERRTQ